MDFKDLVRDALRGNVSGLFYCFLVCLLVCGGDFLVELPCLGTGNTVFVPVLLEKGHCRPQLAKRPAKVVRVEGSLSPRPSNAHLVQEFALDPSQTWGSDSL